MKNLKQWQKVAIAISVIIDLALVVATVVVICTATEYFVIPLMVLIFGGLIEYVIIFQEHIKEVRAVNLAKQKAAREKRASKNTKTVRTIKTVKVLGTRTAAETRILATYNFTVYSLMIIYDDGEREVVECESNSKIFKSLLPYFDVGNETI